MSADTGPWGKKLPDPERVAGGKVRCVHAYYGCDSGCCGQIVYVLRADGENVWESEFDFMHDSAEDARQIANELHLPVEIEPDGCS